MALRVGIFAAFFAGAQMCRAAPSSFRGALAGQMSHRTVSTVDVESTLRDALGAALTGGNAVMASRLAKIEASMWQTFQALPKNEVGRLAPRAVRHIVHSYFAKEHGWVINGLEAHVMQPNVSDVHEADILQDKAPAFVEALLEARRADRGLSLSDVVAMAGALERLIVDESLALLQAAYTLNGETPLDGLETPRLHEVLTSYLMIFELGIMGSVRDTRRHAVMKEAVANSGGIWPMLVEFEQEAVHSFDFQNQHRENAFKPRQYSFQDTSRIVEGLAQDYGKWQNSECRQMKEELMELDTDGSGRVPLRAFYSKPETAEYQFTESVAYLRQIGALDEATNSVRIANYMVGPSNCLAKSTYYSVCCLSECEGLMNQLERKIRAPAAIPERVLSAVANLTASGDMRLGEAAALTRLREIADVNGGEVPLHGRLFAEFLHHAFPTDCPYPHLAEDASVFAPGRWAAGKCTATADERKQVVEAPYTEGEEAETRWSAEEMLPVVEPARHLRGAWASVALTAVQLALVGVVLRFSLSEWSAASAAWRAATSTSSAEKEKSFVLPIRI